MVMRSSRSMSMRLPVLKERQSRGCKAIGRADSPSQPAGTGTGPSSLPARILLILLLLRALAVLAQGDLVLLALELVLQLVADLGAVLLGELLGADQRAAGDLLAEPGGDGRRQFGDGDLGAVLIG